VKLRKLKPAFSTAKKIAEVTGLQLNKVSRLLRLADSPEVVQKGVQEGIKLPAGDAKENGADEQQRTLDLMARSSSPGFTRPCRKTAANARTDYLPPTNRWVRQSRTR